MATPPPPPPTGGTAPPALSFNPNALTNDQINTLINAPIAANSVANTTQINTIHAAMLTKGLTAANSTRFWMAFILACADQGSSSFVQLDGSAENVAFNLAAFEVRKVCTLRQFCMAFAKIAFALMTNNSRPPANWLRAGFTEDTKYAAFDFFNGVTHSAAIDANPPGRPPSADEIRAANLNAAAHIRASRVERTLTTNGNIAIAQQTMSGMRPQLGWS